MNNSTNTILVLLTITAAILAAILIGSYTAGPAYGEVSLKGGDYVIGNMAFSGKRDIIYVIDVHERKMNTYVVNTRAQTLDIVDSKIDLERAFNPNAGKNP